MRSNNTKSRYLYIDNLRLAMIVLVVMLHLAVTYSGIGSWYLKDTVELDIVSFVFFGLFQSFTQAYFMGFLFLISGYFVANSYDKKGCKQFLKDRFIRLGIPTIFYMLVIHPFNAYVLLGNFSDHKPTFIEYYTEFLVSLKFLSASGPLWFAFALLIFNCIYALFRYLTKHSVIEKEKELTNLKTAILIILLIAICAFLIRIVQPIDSSILNMQLCFFSQYIILFIIGIKAGRYDWFSKLTYKDGRKWFFAACIPGILLWVIMLLVGGVLTSGFDIFKGGIHWQSAAYALWESFTAVAMSIGLISIFKEKYNKQGKWVKRMSDSSFTVYMFHSPIIIIVSLVLLNIKIAPIPKFIVACLIGCPLSFLISHNIIRRIPLLKKIL